MDKAHIASLESKHEGLEARITTEQQRPLPDELKIADLKKQKLKLKETLESQTH